jgi:hypothetical protein
MRRYWVRRTPGGVLFAAVLGLALVVAGPVAGFWAPGILTQVAGPLVPSRWEWNVPPAAPAAVWPADAVPAVQLPPASPGLLADGSPALEPPVLESAPPGLASVQILPPVIAAPGFTEAPSGTPGGASMRSTFPAGILVEAASSAATSPVLQAQASGPVIGQAADPSPIQINGILMYRLLSNPYPTTDPASLANLNDLSPTPDFPTINDGTLETAINWTFSPSFNLFADLSLESTTGEVSPLAASDIEEAYLDVHNFGIPGLSVRLGRDRIRLGVDGLLLDENVYDGGRRDGIEAQLAQVGPFTFLAFMQYAVDDGLQIGNWMSSRRLWGGQVTAQILPGWTFDAAFRDDTADPAEVGPCPGIGCNVGSGWSVGVEGAVTRAINVSVEVATYTQSGDIARWYYEPSVAFDLQQLLGLPAQPLLTFWYKNFDPYTAPLDVSLGNFLLPGDFSIYNINDNINAVGGELDVAVTPVVGVFLVAEAGSYKGGGPNYSVYSMGAKWSYTADQIIKVSYNIYQVDGGVVQTSPVSGTGLSTAQVLLVEWTKTF